MIKRICIGLLLLSSAAVAHAQYASVGLMISPLEKSDAMAGIYYNHALGDSYWSLRSTLSFGMERSKEIRQDSLTSHSGSFRYTFALGAQRDIEIKGSEWLSSYIATDFYWASEQLRRPQDTYYGYYYNFGFTPLLGLKFKASPSVQILLEGRANLNFNRQSYSGAGDNYDRKYSFRSMDHLALGLVYVL